MRSAFDIIGPPMIGPSSSHTAGAVRIGLAARHLFGSRPALVRIGLHGSFAASGPGHATDRGIIAGLMGWRPDDRRLKDSASAAAAGGMGVEIFEQDLGPLAHPNSASISARCGAGNTLEMIASSVGGGMIEVISVDGFAVQISATLHTLAIWHGDRPGFLAHATTALARLGSNIAGMRTSRSHRGAGALTILELDAEPPQESLEILCRPDHVTRARHLPPLP